MRTPLWAVGFAAALATQGCGPVDGVSPDAGAPDAGPTQDARRFATRVVSFTPGEGAGFGAERLPEVVEGPPHGRGANAGSTDVLSLGRGGVIVLGFDEELIDGDGPDLIVFENPFRAADGTAFVETGVVAASEDGVDFHEWPCAADAPERGFPGCAGVHPVFASPGNGIDATDPATAGGDAFDLHDLGLARARFVRVRDSGKNTYLAPTGGFDLDAVSLVHAQGLP